MSQMDQISHQQEMEDAERMAASQRESMNQS